MTARSDRQGEKPTAAVDKAQRLLLLGVSILDKQDLPAYKRQDLKDTSRAGKRCPTMQIIQIA